MMCAGTGEPGIARCCADAAVHQDSNFSSQFAPRRDRDVLRRERQLYINPWGGISMRVDF